MDDPGEPLSFLILGILQPFSWNVVIGLLIMAVLLACSALISGAEVAYFSLNPQDRKDLDEAKTRTTILVLDLLKRPKRLLATILIGNNFVNVTMIILSAMLAESVFLFVPTAFWGFHVSATAQGFAVNVVAVTFLIVLFGEVIPKVYANKYSVRLASLMSIPMFVMLKVFQPLSWVLISSTSIIDSRVKKRSNDISVEDLGHALDLTENGGVEQEEKRILEGIVKFGNTDVKAIMKSRVDVETFDVETKYHELLNGIRECGYSRLPVYTGSFDKVEGILYIKDLLPYLNEPDDFEWRTLVRPSFFVPESKKIDDLLKEFQERKMHMAIVVDEYGGTAGIVTLEDIIEEIVGEITDEFDDDDLVYSRLDDNNYVFEAKVLINDFSKVLEIDEEQFDAARGDSETLAGMVLELAGRIPKNNQKVEWKNFTFTVEASDRRRIKRVKVTIDRQKPKMPLLKGKKKKSVSVWLPWVILAGMASFLSSCDETFSPRPKGYMRIDMPEATYQAFEADCPYSFEYSEYATVHIRTDVEETCWLNIEYPRYHGTVHLSYKTVDGDVEKYLEDARNFAYKHTVRASSIEETRIVHPNERVFGLLYELGGRAASSCQFYLTDSTDNFVRGALYFDVAPNADSLAPVQAFVEQDIKHLIETFRWAGRG